MELNMDWEIVAKRRLEQVRTMEEELSKLKYKSTGRPKKSGESATEKIMVNITPTQKEKIVDFVNNNNTTISGLIKSLLTEKNII